MTTTTSSMTSSRNTFKGSTTTTILTLLTMALVYLSFEETPSAIIPSTSSSTTREVFSNRELMTFDQAANDYDAKDSQQQQQQQQQLALTKPLDSAPKLIISKSDSTVAATTATTTTLASTGASHLRGDNNNNNNGQEEEGVVPPAAAAADKRPHIKLDYGGVFRPKPQHVGTPLETIAESAKTVVIENKQRQNKYNVLDVTTDDLVQSPEPKERSASVFTSTTPEAAVETFSAEPLLNHPLLQQPKMATNAARAEANQSGPGSLFAQELEQLDQPPPPPPPPQQQVVDAAPPQMAAPPLVVVPENEKAQQTITTTTTSAAQVDPARWSDFQQLRKSSFTAGYKLDGPPLFSSQHCDVPKLVNFNATSDGFCRPAKTHIPDLYDRRSDMRAHYIKKMHSRIFIKNREHRDLPPIHTFVNGTFIIWQGHSKSWASAWNDTHEMEGKGWRAKPDEHYREPIILRGDFVAYTSWYEGNYGHYFDDHLPSIAYLKSQVPYETHFLLHDNPLAHEVLAFLDPDFYERIVWIQMRKPYRVVGNLIVNQPLGLPLMLGCCRPYDYLRHWITTKHPPPGVREPRTVVYYSRQSHGTLHGRQVEPSLEARIIETIRDAMVRYNRPEHELVVFTGEDADGNALSIAEQFRIFRSAKTIIGPHGAGMLGNFAWIHPLPGKCERRVQVLEFIPSPESTDVQPLYQSLFMRWRHWPAEFHVLLYTAQSSADTTYIELNDLRDGLEGMWGQRDTTTIPVESAIATVM